MLQTLSQYASIIFNTQKRQAGCTCCTAMSRCTQTSTLKQTRVMAFSYSLQACYFNFRTDTVALICKFTEALKVFHVIVLYLCGFTVNFSRTPPI